MKKKIAAIFLVLTFLATTARATPTPEDIVRSFSQNMDQEPDYSRLIPWLFVLAGAVAGIVFFRQYQRRQAVPRALNHPGKLLREIGKITEVDAQEMKKLKQLADELGCENPLTLLLCPSLLGKPHEQADAETTSSTTPRN